VIEFCPSSLGQSVPLGRSTAPGMLPSCGCICFRVTRFDERIKVSADSSRGKTELTAYLGGSD
jgi:hypothetical protein